MSSRSSYPKCRNTQPLNRRHNSAPDRGSTRPTYNPELGSVVRYADLVKALDNGNIAIQTWTLPRGNIPIMTLAPVSVFIQLLADGRSPCLLVDKLTEDVRKSVATEGDHLHADLVCAMAYALTGHPEKALDWWLSVGIVRQFNISPSDSIRAQIDALVHPLWSPQLVKQFNPATGQDEPYYDA